VDRQTQHEVAIALDDAQQAMGAEVVGHLVHLRVFTVAAQVGPVRATDKVTGRGG
jgi:hypothetical protein